MNKSSNVIKLIVKNVGFNQVCNALLDSGYTIDKKDNDLQTVKTELKSYLMETNSESLKEGD